ncbi:hypothetical protein BAUCODRAFT_303189 [Baudoinia panamericana UAMH 10762]|uniref:Uncharacterized protein n=1 Tax=Baudoinia panamericana (strain UAMH 10762) TaxID=717646 RepID=M2M557_BAUPA|nr:uncharacterized protein BAUCODRAFT_303189 [Baudoinia panamericana UAMH 10762]EMC91751.1 hypothetical protein BAUCODRAFT_303189 [Baudoinia panamericana UAMH 10762]
MSKSPRERLHKLFHKHESGTKREDATPAAPASPTSGAQSSLHRRLSRNSLRDVLHGTGFPTRSRSRGISTTIDPAISAETTSAATAAASAAAIRSVQPAQTTAATQLKQSTERTQLEQSADMMQRGRPTRAVQPEQDLRLPNVAHPTDLSADLRHLTLSDPEPTTSQRGDMVDRGTIPRKPRKSEVKRPVEDTIMATIPSNGQTAATKAARPQSGATNGALPSNVKSSMPEGPRYSNESADWNGVQHEKPVLGSLSDLPTPLKIKKKASMDYRADEPGSPVSPISSRSLSHKHDVSDLRRSSDAARTKSPVLSSRSPQQSRDLEQPTTELHDGRLAVRTGLLHKQRLWLTKTSILMASWIFPRPRIPLSTSHGHPLSCMRLSYRTCTRSGTRRLHERSTTTISSIGLCRSSTLRYCLRDTSSQCKAATQRSPKRNSPDGLGQRLNGRSPSLSRNCSRMPQSPYCRPASPHANSKAQTATTKSTSRLKVSSGRSSGGCTLRPSTSRRRLQADRRIPSTSARPTRRTMVYGRDCRRGM